MAIVLMLFVFMIGFLAIMMIIGYRLGQKKGRPLYGVWLILTRGVFGLVAIERLPDPKRGTSAEVKGEW